MAETKKLRKPTRRSHENQFERRPDQKPPPPPPSWAALRIMFSCKHQHCQENRRRCGRIVCSVSMCKEGSKVLMTRAEPAPPPPEHYKKLVSVGGCSNGGGSRSLKKLPLKEINGPAAASSSSFSSFSSSANSASPLTVAAAVTTTAVTATSSSSSSSSTSSSASVGGSFRGRRRFSGCYECHSVVDPSSTIPRGPSMRSTICACPDCGEIFVKPESLELHQAARHAVSELGPEDTSRNIVEIIFQSSWLKKQDLSCKIDRILKVNNTLRTIARFEDYRDSVKRRANRLSAAARKHPRCVADGNELLRFHCTTFACSIGSDGSDGLCRSAATLTQCRLCGIVGDGFKADAAGRILTMATSGRAHDAADVAAGGGGGDEKRAMLVCRVIAGRVRRSQQQDAATEEYDSVSGPAGAYSNLDKLFVFNPRAILPCFLVIYRTQTVV